MNEKKKMTLSIIGEDGSIDEVEVVIAFEFKDTKKEYVVYTKNEKDENGNVTVYVSRVDRSTETPKLYGIDDEEEWNRVKDVLRKLSKKDSKYSNKVNNTVEKIEELRTKLVLLVLALVLFLNQANKKQ